MQNHTTTFAPMLYLDNVAAGIDYYTKAFGALELRRFSNPDGTVHVAEMSIGSALFRLHEEVLKDTEFSPRTLKGTTVIIGLLVGDPDFVVAKAVAAGGIGRDLLLQAIRDYFLAHRGWSRGCDRDTRRPDL